MAGIIGEHYFKEGERVGEGALIMELRKDLEEIEVKRRQTLLDAANSDLERTRRLSKSTKSVSEENVEKAEAAFAVAEAELQAARAQLKQKQIFAPFSGEISDLFNLEEGEIARLQTPLVRLVDTKHVLFVTHVDAVLAKGLTAGVPVDLTIGRGSDAKRFQGKVEFVSPVVESSSGLLRVRVSFDNSEGAIRPGIAGKMSWGGDR